MTSIFYDPNAMKLPSGNGYAYDEEFKMWMPTDPEERKKFEEDLKAKVAPPPPMSTLTTTTTMPSSSGTTTSESTSSSSRPKATPSVFEMMDPMQIMQAEAAVGGAKPKRAASNRRGRGRYVATGLANPKSSAATGDVMAPPMMPSMTTPSTMNTFVPPTPLPQDKEPEPQDE
eukprot:m.133926 g.133926  ORF g.133926 m.133926 type:complete len:173 (-) comp29709_c1_seq1:151-669(-)